MTVSGTGFPLVFKKGIPLVWIVEKTRILEVSKTCLYLMVLPLIFCDFIQVTQFPPPKSRVVSDPKSHAERALHLCSGRQDDDW